MLRKQIRLQQSSSNGVSGSRNEDGDRCGILYRIGNGTALFLEQYTHVAANGQTEPGSFHDV
jgi:hypothetical protein